MNNVSLTSDNLSQAALSTSTPVSVIMPVRNEERHLAEAVRHVLAQDYPARIEVVLAVGPSGDATAQIARGLAAALVTMHVCWGIGFLTSPRRLMTRTARDPG